MGGTNGGQCVYGGQELPGSRDAAASGIPMTQGWGQKPFGEGVQRPFLGIPERLQDRGKSEAVIPGVRTEAVPVVQG